MPRSEDWLENKAFRAFPVVETNWKIHNNFTFRSQFHEKILVSIERNSVKLLNILSEGTISQ